MEMLLVSFVEYCATMPDWHKVAWAAVCLSVSWVFEFASPAYIFNYKKIKHIGVNVVFLLTSGITGIVLALLTVSVIAWAGEQRIGLLYSLNLPVWLHFLAGIVLLDVIAQYGVHFLLHKVKWMWRLHMVHHSDTHVDATTGTRHHPGDYLTREIAALFAMLIFGIPIEYYLGYRMITIFFAYFTHANIRLGQLDRILSYIIVTPDMHKFHHHIERPWTDSNFGNILSIWDRMYGTLVYENPQDVRFGLDVLDGSRDMDLVYQYKLPFNGSIKTDQRSGLSFLR